MLWEASYEGAGYCVSGSKVDSGYDIAECLSEGVRVDGRGLDCGLFHQHKQGTFQLA